MGVAISVFRGTTTIKAVYDTINAYYWVDMFVVALCSLMSTTLKITNFAFLNPRAVAAAAAIIGTGAYVYSSNMMGFTGGNEAANPDPQK
jgi:hypothetical protein